MAKTDFLTLNDLSPPALFKVLERAHVLKAHSKRGSSAKPLNNMF